MSILLRTAILCAALLVFGAADATAQKRCSKGIPCGNTCIAANKTCRVGSPASRPSTNRPASASAVVPPGTQYVASNRGSTYYYVGCNGWKSLAPANRIYFKSVEEARSKGLKPSTQAGCAGPANNASRETGDSAVAPPDSTAPVVGKCAYSISGGELIGPIIGIKSDTVTVFRTQHSRTEAALLKEFSVRACP